MLGLRKRDIKKALKAGAKAGGVSLADVRADIEALKQLSERNRETLLMYYFLEMNNEEIAKKQNISRSGVFQNRHNSLALMKKLLKEKQ